MIEALAQHPAVQPVGWALLHSLWQGCLVALLLAAVLALLPKDAARGRYAAACGALILLLALPVASAFKAPDKVAGTFEAATLNKVAGTSAQVAGTSGALPVPAQDTGSETAPTGLSSLPVETLLPWLFAFWLAGVAGLGAYHLIGWQRCRELRRRGTAPAPKTWSKVAQRLGRRLGLQRPVDLVQTSVLEVPAVVGWLRPVLLVPTAAFAAMPPQQLEAILAHELAHVQRWDYLVNLLQTAAETLLFFHPAVWWISHQARLEREHCCDDLAVAVCGDRALYARALAGLEEIRSAPGIGGRPALGAAMAADGASLLGRIRRLAGLPPRRGSLSRPRTWLTAIATVLAVLGTAQLSLTSQDVDAAAVPPAPTEDLPLMQAQDLGDVTHRGTWVLNRKDHRRFLSLEFKDVDRPDWRASFSIRDEEVDPAKDHWVLARDAGQFDFRVTERKGTGTVIGEYTFRPNLEFQREMEALGYSLEGDAPFHLAVLNLRLALVQELADLGYRDMPLKQLVAMHIHEAGPDYIRALQDRGYRELPAERLVEMRIHEVTPEFIDQLTATGWEGVAPKELTQLRIHEVDSGFIRDFQDLGYTDLDRERAVQLRIHEVTPEFIESFAAVGYPDLPLNQLVALRIHEVTPEFVEELAALGYREIPAKMLIALRIHDVTPDFIREMEAEGVEDLSIKRLLDLKIRGRQAVDTGVPAFNPAAALQQALWGGKEEVC